MSDNPERPVIATLGIDDSGAQLSDFLNQVDELNALYDKLQSQLEQVNNTAEQGKNTFDVWEAGNLNLAQSLGTTVEQLDAMNAAFQSSNLQQQIDDMVKLADATQQAADAEKNLTEQQANTETAYSNYLGRNVGYGTEGGAIGPAEDDSGGDGGAGSTYGIARALRVGGTLTKSPALSEAGGFLYISQGIGQLQTVLEGLNASVTPLIQSIPLVGTQLANIPFAPLALAAAPVIIALGALAAVFSILKGEADDAAAAVKNELDTKTKAAEIEQQGTTESITTEINKQKAIADAQIEGQADAIKKMADASGFSTGDISKFIESLKVAGQTPDDIAKNLKGSSIGVSAFGRFQGPEFQQAADSFVEMQKKIADASTAINANEEALHSAAVATNDAVQAAIKYADSHAKEAAQYAADDKSTVAATQDRVQALKDEVAAQQAGIDKINETASHLTQGSDAWQEATKAIAAHQAIITQDTAEIQHLTEVSIPLAQARAAQAATEADLKKAVDDYVKAATEAQTTTQKWNDDIANWKAQADQVNTDRLAQVAEQTAAYQQTVADDTANFHQQQADSEVAYQETRQEKIDAFQVSIADIQDKAATAQATEIQTYQTQQVQAAQDLAAKLRDINETARVSELDAASKLDARAVERAQEKQALDTSKAEESYNVEKERRQEAEQRKLNDLAANENREIAQRTDAFQRQLALEDRHEAEKEAKAEENFRRSEEKKAEQFNLQQEKQKEQWKKQDDATAEQHAKELDALNTHLETLATTQQDAYTRMEDDTAVNMANLQTIISNGLQNASTAATTIFSQLQNYVVQAQNNFGGPQTNNPYGPVTTNNAPASNTIPFNGQTFAEGGITPAERRSVLVGERGPELAVFPSNTQIYNSSQTSNMLNGGGGKTVNISLNGKNGADKTQIMNILTELLEEVAAS